MEVLVKLCFVFICLISADHVHSSEIYHAAEGHDSFGMPYMDIDNELMFGKKVSPAVPVTSSCTAFIDYFGQLAANYTRCVVLFARPLRVCENCVEQYIHAKSAFEFVMTGQHKDEHGVDCGQMVLNSDRIQIIVRTHNFISKMWDDCSCNHCFDFVDGTNGTVHYRLSNETMRFNELAAETLSCFHNHSHESEMVGNHSRNTSAVCRECVNQYQEMNSLYNGMVDTYHHHVCMDVVDEMNSTRLIWSKTYGCSQKVVDPTTVFVVSGIFSLIPIFFYVGNRIHVSRTRQAVLNQNEHPRENNNTGNETQEETTDENN